MSQYSVYKNENKSSKKTYPFFVDVQSDLLDSLNSRVVIPLSLSEAMNNINVKNLCPIFEIGDKRYILLAHQMTSIPASLLKKNVGSLENKRYEILREKRKFESEIEAMKKHILEKERRIKRLKDRLLELEKELDESLSKLEKILNTSIDRP